MGNKEKRQDARMQKGFLKRGNTSSLFFVRGFAFFLVLLGCYGLVREAVALQTGFRGTVLVVLGLAVHVLVTGWLVGGTKKRVGLRYAYGGILIVLALVFHRVVWSSYLALENGIRNQLNDYYGLELAQRTQPVSGTGAAWFLLLVFGLLAVLLCRQVIVRGRAALLIMVELLFLLAGLACGCTFGGWGIFLLAIGTFALLAMGYERGARGSQALLGRSGAWMMLALTVLGIFSAAMMPVLLDKTESVHEKLYEAMEQSVGRFSSRLTGANGFFGNHNPTADGSLNNYPVEQEEKTDLVVTVSEQPAGSVYLRGFVGNTYEGTYWRRADASDFEEAFPEEGSAAQIQNILYRYIALESGGTAESTLTVERVDPGGEYGYVPYAFQVPDDDNLISDMTYASASDENTYSGYVNWQVWIGTGAAEASESEIEEAYQEYVADQYLKVPVEGLDRLREYCNAQDIQSVQEAIDFVVQAVQTDHTYSMDLEDVPDDTDFAEYFFFDSKEGYCIHYATTATLMLRMLGVPARYVTGYLVTSDKFTAEADGSYSADVLDTQAHAWVEVYRAGKGWIPLEVTPGLPAAADTSLTDTENESGSADEASAETEVTPTPETDGTEEQPAEAEPTEEQPTEEASEDTTEQIGDGDAPLELTPDPASDEGNNEDISEDKEGQTGNNGGENSGERHPVLTAVLVLLLLLLAAGAVCLYLWLRSDRKARERRKAFRQKNRSAGVQRIAHVITEMAEVRGLPIDGDRDEKRARQLEEALPRLEKDSYSSLLPIFRQAAYGPNMVSKEDRDRCLKVYERIVEELWAAMSRKEQLRWKYLLNYDVPKKKGKKRR